ncbi:hypothetical protein NLU13_5619 [Sarocladium strictum]|uniref:Uncharacterized protein n=1 Tax=Sarocladium strictum TaxID=5046 RepID=A0AA39GHJ8_SARSR|nr:hypothetical protein NLU13_5619 [Sarocladium strictum]
MADDRKEDDATPRAEVSEEQALKGTKTKKRSLFGFGKKKNEESSPNSKTSQPPSLPNESSNLSSAPSITSNPQTDAPLASPSSPNRALSNSPRLASPARSQIFERDVQDSTSIKPSSPAIPGHIQTENYIPPALDEASEVITNENLDPDSVEIVTHNAHQPASVTVTGTAPYDQPASNWVEELASFEGRDGLPPDNASHYGSLDSADVRRLSFISFADVVQSEQLPNLASSRESIHMAGLTSLTSANLNRSPSPIRSPVSSQGGPGTSPPTSNPGSVKGFDMSPARKPLGSPISGTGQISLNPPQGDLNIETMSQALRRTGSADLSHVRSMPTSPIDGPGSR